MTGNFIDHLPTPCGDIAITDAAGRRVPFSLRENPYCPVYSLFYGTIQEEMLRPDANYLLCVPTGDDWAYLHSAPFGYSPALRGQ